MKATQYIHWLIAGKYRLIARHVIYLDHDSAISGTIKDGRRVRKDSKGVWIIDEQQEGGEKNGTSN